MHCEQLLADFFTVMDPLDQKIGLWKIQLPAHFGPQALPALEKFLRKLPTHLTFGVEVRHPAFFAKGEEEKALNRRLVDQQANRIIMDSRPGICRPPANLRGGD